MTRNLIETLVIERRHQLCIGRRAVGFLHRQRPFLLLARCQAVTEGLPLQLQLFVGQWPQNLRLVGIELTLLHPGEGEQQTVAIFRFVCQFAVNELIRTVDGTTLDNAVATDDAVDDMHVLSRRAYLYGDGGAVVGELGIRHIEPIIGLKGRPLVVEVEDGECLLQTLTLALCLYLVPATFQLGQFYAGIGLGCQPFRSPSLGGG